MSVLGVEDLELPPIAGEIDAPVCQDTVHVEKQSLYGFVIRDL
jgi:hypothetical protein